MSTGDTVSSKVLRRKATVTHKKHITKRMTNLVFCFPLRPESTFKEKLRLLGVNTPTQSPPSPFRRAHLYLVGGRVLRRKIEELVSDQAEESTGLPTMQSCWRLMEGLVSRPGAWAL